MVVSRTYPFQDLRGLLNIADEADTRHGSLVAHPGNALGLEGRHQGIQLSIHQIPAPHFAAAQQQTDQKSADALSAKLTQYSKTYVLVIAMAT